MEGERKRAHRAREDGGKRLDNRNQKYFPTNSCFVCANKQVFAVCMYVFSQMRSKGHNRLKTAGYYRPLS